MKELKKCSQMIDCLACLTCRVILSFTRALDSDQLEQTSPYTGKYIHLIRLINRYQPSERRGFCQCDYMESNYFSIYAFIASSISWKIRFFYLIFYIKKKRKLQGLYLILRNILCFTSIYGNNLRFYSCRSISQRNILL